MRFGDNRRPERSPLSQDAEVVAPGRYVAQRFPLIRREAVASGDAAQPRSTDCSRALRPANVASPIGCCSDGPRRAARTSRCLGVPDRRRGAAVASVHVGRVPRRRATCVASHRDAPPCSTARRVHTRIGRSSRSTVPRGGEVPARRHRRTPVVAISALMRRHRRSRAIPVHRRRNERSIDLGAVTGFERRRARLRRCRTRRRRRSRAVVCPLGMRPSGGQGRNGVGPMAVRRSIARPASDAALGAASPRSRSRLVDAADLPPLVLPACRSISTNGQDRAYIDAGLRRPQRSVSSSTAMARHATRGSASADNRRENLLRNAGWDIAHASLTSR